MKQIENTQELKIWFDTVYDVLKQKYEQRRNSGLNKSLSIEKSIAYHTINELAIKEGYYLTDCQINKIVPLLIEMS